MRDRGRDRETRLFCEVVELLLNVGRGKVALEFPVALRQEPGERKGLHGNNLGLSGLNMGESGGLLLII